MTPHVERCKPSNIADHRGLEGSRGSGVGGLRPSPMSDHDPIPTRSALLRASGPSLARDAGLPIGSVPQRALQDALPRDPQDETLDDAARTAPTEDRRT